MNVLPPGTILQLMYLRERLLNVDPGCFIEIGPGSGEVSALLLDLGWGGAAYDLESRTVERLRSRFKREISQGRYDVYNQDYLALNHGHVNKVDLIISCMVMEHFTDRLESKYMDVSHAFLTDNGFMIGLVPASPAHWGIEDDIAGHCRRYTRDKIYELANNNRWEVSHLVGLTYPVSNILLPISNLLVRRAEESKITLPGIEKTKASGIRDVKYKTNFPNALALILNSRVMLPLYWLQKAFSASISSLVLYFEARPLQHTLVSHESTKS